MLMAGVFLLGAIQGFIKGFVRQLAGLVGLVAGLLIARALFGVVGERLASQMGMSVGFGQILAFGLIWMVVPITLSLMAYLLTKTLEAVRLGFINRWLGAGLGAIKYLLAASILICVIEWVDADGTLLINKEQKEQSKLYYPMEQLAGVFLPAAAEWATTVEN